MKTVLIFAKSPRMGSAKTRLARDIGPVQAIRWARFSQARALRAGRSQAWHTRLCITPERDATQCGLWPKAMGELQGQGTGDLGARLARAFASAPPGPVLVIGTDIPDIRPAALARAFFLLRGRSAVFGPAHDGGFWLFGLSAAVRRACRVFPGIRWSTSHALADMQAILPMQTHIHHLEYLIDLDDAASLAAWQAGHPDHPDHRAR